MSRAGVGVAALMAVGALALGGCAEASPQVAAYVGGDQIRLAQVEAISQELSRLSPDQTDVADNYRATVLAVMIESRLAEQVAAAKSIVMTEEMRQSFYATNDAYKVMAGNAVTADFMKGFADLAIVVGTEAGKVGLRDAFSTTPIRVNPRFGTWDPANQVVTGDGSLSVAFTPSLTGSGPRETPAASPTAGR